MKHFKCTCENVLFFGSSRCLRCQQNVGFDPLQRQMSPCGPSTELKLCANGQKYAVCNWLVPAEKASRLCRACTMNRTIPDLSKTNNSTLWTKMEMAKRRLLYTLDELHIPMPSLSEDGGTGVAFDIVSTYADPSVTMGHLKGVITVNLEEADDTYRQINRQQLGENSRTLLGHFRHESGHYLWYRQLSDLPWDHPLREAFRAVFGSESKDYASSLQLHYRRGAPLGWERDFITPYAASHPWEDWAETWAHYLQIIDGLETCESLGIQVSSLALPLVIIPEEAGNLPPPLMPDPQESGRFLAMLQRWICLSSVLNEISQSLGESALYPYIITVPTARKLRLAHHFAQSWRVK
jgi:hypothetical protein